MQATGGLAKSPPMSAGYIKLRDNIQNNSHESSQAGRMKGAKLFFVFTHCYVQ